MQIRPLFGTPRGILVVMAADTTLEDQTMTALVAEACDAFQRDYRYAEAMARQASALQSRRESRSLRAA